MFLDPDKKVTIHNHDLPHWQQADTYIFINSRLADSVPQSLIQDWKSKRETWTEKHPHPWTEEIEKEYHATFSTQFENWLDQGMGDCLLRQKENAQIVADCLLHDHQKLYEMDNFVIMPNHVHLLVRLADTPLEKLMQTWKSVTSHRINKGLKKTGPLWQARYWDTLIRSQRHLLKVRNYIKNNPTKAKLPPSDFIFWMK